MNEFITPHLLNETAFAVYCVFSKEHDERRAAYRWRNVSPLTRKECEETAMAVLKKERSMQGDCYD